eukprot:scaffold183273_cov15-Tisochrysis_lutea.AAC.3
MNQQVDSHQPDQELCSIGGFVANDTFSGLACIQGKGGHNLVVLAVASPGASGSLLLTSAGDMHT